MTNKEIEHLGFITRTRKGVTKHHWVVRDSRGATTAVSAKGFTTKQSALYNAGVVGNCINQGLREQYGYSR